MAERERRVYEVLIRATPEAIWQALVDPERTQQYYFGTRVESDWSPQSPVRYRDPAGEVPVEGEVVEFEPPRRLVTTFRAFFAAGGNGDAEPATVSWEIEPMGEVSKLTLTHDGFEPGSPAADQVHLGWVHTVSSLKSLLETGNAINIFGSG
jgi:uncharacterized protein YndB with AHSA1/START domain